MNIEMLCDRIGLQPELRARVNRFSEGFDFAKTDAILEGFFRYSDIDDTHSRLLEAVGEDPDGMLACMLRAAAVAYGRYREMGIADDIWVATMSCFPRFVAETLERTGQLYFDRHWWTGRQVGCHLFRIGELEYEKKTLPEGIRIGIHIPSDAVFNPDKVDASLAAAKRFFAKHYPETLGCEWRCHSWLMDPQLSEFLPEHARILSFQRRFTIFDPGEVNGEFLEWVFHTDQSVFAALSETPALLDTLPGDTSLQRALKAHLGRGGVIRNAYGRLKETGAR